MSVTTVLVWAAPGSMVVCSAEASGKIVYVDDDAAAGGDGSCWERAYKYPQDGPADVNDSPKPVEVRVAQGLYRPDRSAAEPGGSGDRKVSFELQSGLALIGGCAIEPNEWNVEAYETVLRGDLAGNDIEGKQNVI